MNSASSKEQIITWLFQLSEYEKICMGYYRNYGAHIPVTKANQLLAKHDIRVINEINPIKDGLISYQMDLFPATAAQVYDEQPFPNKQEAFSILKHPRYHNCTVHKHSFFEFSFVVSGTCKHIIYTENESELALTANDLILIPPDVNHKLIVEDDSIVINIIVRASWMKDCILDCLPKSESFTDLLSKMVLNKEIPSIPLFHTKHCPDIRNMILDLIIEFCQTENYRNQLISLSFCRILIYVMMHAEADFSFHKTIAPMKDLIPSVITYINKNYATVQCKHIAENFGFSLTHINKNLKMELGMSLHNYLTYVKINKAKELLKQSSLMISEIAQLVGYADAANFIKSFKSLENTTPAQYRKTYGIKGSESP